MANEGKERLAGDVSLFNYYTVVVGGMGFVAACIANTFRRKPALAGFFFLHVPNWAIGSVAGYYMAKVVDRKKAERNFITEDYVRRNKEDFVPGPPRSMNEGKSSFVPVR